VLLLLDRTLPGPQHPAPPVLLQDPHRRSRSCCTLLPLLLCLLMQQQEPLHAHTQEQLLPVLQCCAMLG
jgi:hypothetical protein